jgi:hypothetical protein
MSNRWTGSGSRFHLHWGGRHFELATDSERPGLTELSGRPGVLLGLDGLAAQGRDGAGVLGNASLRAAWIPRSDDVVDLEVQLVASSVGDLKAVQVLVSSDLGTDVRTAGTSESLVLAHLEGPSEAASAYLEMIHPDDSALRPGLQSAGRHALFGHDLERGVVLRGRLRGIWLASEPVEAEVSRLFDEFLKEPLPLGI